MEKAKNPLIIGVVIAVLVYAYLRWDAKKKQQEDPKANAKPVGLLLPGVAGGLAWFLSSSYLSSKLSLGLPRGTAPIGVGNPHCLKSQLSLSEPTGAMAISSVELLRNRNLKLPKTDVFIDIGDF